MSGDEPTARQDADTETRGHVAVPAASGYTLGQPHPSSHPYSLEELLAERMSEQDVQQALKRFQEVIAPQILQTLDAAFTTIEIRDRLKPLATALTEFFSKLVSVRDAWLPHMAQTLGAMASVLHGLPKRIMRAEAPPNWQSLDDDELDAVIATAEAGIPVAWVPRTMILQLLLAADTADQFTVLDTHATDIVDDCAAAVGQARSGTFEEFAAYAEEAILTYRAGHPAASQALSASIIDTLLRVTVLAPTKNRYYGKVKATITAGHNFVPGVIACLPVLNALENFDGHSDVPATFNRHASAHAVYAQQYTPTNALISLMLATSLLRQAHHTAHEALTQDETPVEDDFA